MSSIVRVRLAAVRKDEMVIIWHKTMLIMALFVAGCADHDNKPGELQEGRTRVRVESFCISLEAYREEFKSLPRKEESMRAIAEISDNDYRDGWGQIMRPMISGPYLVGIYSSGKNHRDDGGGGDDVVCVVGEHVN